MYESVRRDLWLALAMVGAVVMGGATLAADLTANLDVAGAVTVVGVELLGFALLLVGSIALASAPRHHHHGWED